MTLQADRASRALRLEPRRSSSCRQPRQRQRRVEVVATAPRELPSSTSPGVCIAGFADKPSSVAFALRDTLASMAAAGGNAPTARPAAASRPMSLCQQLRRRDDIAEALRHLLGAHVDEAVVHPVARERRAAVRAAALRDLILVVREDEVEPAAMDVDRLAEMRARSSPSIRCASPAGPRPHGESQPITPSPLGFHSTKSAGSRLYGATSTLAPATIASRSRVLSAP